MNQHLIHRYWFQLLDVRLNFVGKNEIWYTQCIMTDIDRIATQIENVDQLPVIYGLLQKMKIQTIVDKVIQPHGNWQGLSVGWVVTIWLMHILTQYTHQMDCVEAWVGSHLMVLRKLTREKVTTLDFTDDRLALCLRYLCPVDVWSELESQLTQGVIRVYNLERKLPSRWLVRLDATVGIVEHDANNHTLFQVGKGKNGLYATLFKMMVASLDPLGMPIAVDVVAGNRADDPLYVPVVFDKGKMQKTADQNVNKMNKIQF